MLDDIKKTLWATADKLRANMDAAEYKHLVLGLIFVKYISDTFAARRAEVAARLTDPARRVLLRPTPRPKTWPPSWKTATTTRAVNVFWVPEGARWEAAARRRPSSPTLASASTTR